MKKESIFATVLISGTTVLLLKGLLKKNILSEKSLAKRSVSGGRKTIKKYKKQGKAEEGEKIKLYAEIISSEPMILKSKDSASSFYYWVSNPEKMGCWITTAVGWVKRTGQYKNYQGEICAVVEAVPVKTCNSKIGKLKKKVDERI